MTLEDSESEWKAMFEYWVDLLFKNHHIEVYKTVYMGLGKL